MSIVMTTKPVRVRFAASPAIYGFTLLKQGDQPSPEQVAALAWEYFRDRLPARESCPDAIKEWFRRLLATFLPTVDRLDQLPAAAGFLFDFDIQAARTEPENAAVLAADSARTVLAEFANRARTHRGPVTPNDFKRWMNAIKAATGVKGAELFDPVRIALTGTHSGPELDKLLPLIEDGAALGLGIARVRERAERFVGV